MNKTEIARIVSAWGIKSFSFRPLNGGMVNENFFIGSDTGAYVLRKLGFLKGLKGLKKELDYLLYFNNQRFKYKVPTPLYTTNNALFVENGGQVFWLYRYIDGTIKDNTSYDQIEEIARMISDYHRLTKSYKKIRVRSATRDPFFRKGIRKFSLSLMPKRDMVLRQEDKIFIENINDLLFILNELNVPGYESLATYPINSDIKYDNLIWKGKKLVGIIDFR
jgi:Putative homoserine kinase type II (protein kinase fold)